MGWWRDRAPGICVAITAAVPGARRKSTATAKQDRSISMTVITDAPAAVAGISAAELAAMEDAASASRERFTDGRPEYAYYSGHSSHVHQILAAAGLFSALAEPFSPPPAHRRAGYAIVNACGGGSRGSGCRVKEKVCALCHRPLSQCSCGG
jgi:hypothetical protein